MEAFGRFLDILDELRVKCPWDRKQTNESLRPNTIEETYELCDALMRDDKKDICKELGDVLLHVAFYAKIGSETGDFDIKDVCDKLHIRKYGAHGTSYRYISKKVAEMTNGEARKVVVCHIGSGASLCAIEDGKCMDTSMCLSPLAGVPMGTRSGDIDACVVQFICNKYNMSVDDCLTMLNKKSGMLGISGVSSDFRDLGAAAQAGNERAKLALDMFIYSVKKYIGSYAAAMNGVDAIVFTAGVGENDRSVRAGVLKDMEYLGILPDFEYNETCPRGEEVCISKPESPVKVFVIPTDEEMAIARDTARLAL